MKLTQLEQTETELKWINYDYLTTGGKHVNNSSSTLVIFFLAVYVRGHSSSEPDQAMAAMADCCSL